ncbi:DinB family protein [Solimicrobium silvestre]|uniref:DinB family n=1 Tax=Solimicrobium silvestre TaxID=2099400 RepID=A0A2S9H4H1_9BURK|nr:DinB family protein [Solimicrobium silvestre]PRC94885.1 hypothetical protein S2091_0080 [Solimicrobium silvestre]
MTELNNIRMLTRYKAWANKIIYETVASLPADEATKERPTRFKNMVHTLNHIYVIDHIFQAHLEGRKHDYQARNTPTHPPLEQLWQSVQVLDNWYVELSDKLTADALGEMINFHFVDGGAGRMTRAQMILHVVNHGTYHRGFVGDMLYQVPVIPPATDLPVFLRDVPQN